MQCLLIYAIQSVSHGLAILFFIFQTVGKYAPYAVNDKVIICFKLVRKNLIFCGIAYHFATSHSKRILRSFPAYILESLFAILQDDKTVADHINFHWS